MSPIPSIQPVQFDKPVPRQPSSQSKTVQIQTQNRRREYLSRVPSYFDSLEHEFADPVLYERLVKRFQSASEREAESKAKGYGRTLEADLQRGESKLSKLQEFNQQDQDEEQDPDQSQGPDQAQLQPQDNGVDPSNTAFEHPWEQSIADKEQGIALWRAFLQERFIHGQDDDFDYSRVDKDDDLDTMVRKDAEDAWFDDEEPSWLEIDDHTKPPESRVGETGVQDY